jgi:hypothetical protein
MRKHFESGGAILAGLVFGLMFIVSGHFLMAPKFEAQSGSGSFNLNSTLGRLNIAKVPAKVSITNAQGAQTNQAYSNIAFRDNSNSLVPSVPFIMWYSDSATCAGLTATTASGTADIIGTTGANFAALTAKKAFQLQASSLGIAQFGVLDSAKTVFFPCVYTPWSGVVTGPQLATGNYK